MVYVQQTIDLSRPFPTIIPHSQAKAASHPSAMSATTLYTPPYIYNINLKYPVRCARATVSIDVILYVFTACVQASRHCSGLLLLEERDYDTHPTCLCADCVARHAHTVYCYTLLHIVCRRCKMRRRRPHKRFDSIM